MRKRLRGAPPMVLAAIALFVALGGGYAIGAAKIKTRDIANQAVTNKKIKKDTIKGNRIDEASLSGAGTGLAISEPTNVSVPVATTSPKAVLTLPVPQAGSYLFIAKAVLNKGGPQTAVQCVLSAGGDSDRSLEDVDAANNTTIVNTLPHTFAGTGSATLACDNPDPTAPLLVTNIRVNAIPLGALSVTNLP
jgi:hypothetical protein